jgi:rod shape determining protein RodA
MNQNTLDTPDLTLGQKLLHIHWLFVILLCLAASIGLAMLYSAANGNLEPWALKQFTRFCLGVGVMIAISLIDIRIWMRYSYFFYLSTLFLLIIVELFGTIGMGAQRWLNFGYFNLQPSELMKITLILALARYFHGGSIEDVGRPMYLIPPLLMIGLPAALIFRQPDLGTSLLLVIASGAIFFTAGVRMWKFGVIIALGIGAMPVAWLFLHEYQKRRVLTFLNPESDPLGAGYHIIQSQIALGSGGIFGKGFMQGTQGHLRFLPEMQTDFIFTMLAEEFGMMGGLGLLTLYGLIIIYGFAMTLRSRNQFGRLVGVGVTTTFFLYVFINIAMVMGLIPVVGVPLPLISYGGTAMMTLLIGFGLLLSVWIHRDIMIGRRGGDEV